MRSGNKGRNDWRLDPAEEQAKHDERQNRPVSPGQISRIKELAAKCRVKFDPKSVRTSGEASVVILRLMRKAGIKRTNFRGQAT
jgi:hypothetical protein